MFDIDYLNETLKQGQEDLMPKSMENCGTIRDLGLLVEDEVAIKFCYNNMWIFANGVVIASTFNDSSSAAGAFSAAMIGAYGNKFQSAF